MLRHLILLLILVLAVAAGLLVAVFNGQDATINYHFGAINLPLIAIVLISVAVGSVLGMLVLSGAWIRARRRARKLRRELKKANKEIDDLRQLSTSLAPTSVAAKSSGASSQQPRLAQSSKTTSLDALPAT